MTNRFRRTDSNLLGKAVEICDRLTEAEIEIEAAITGNPAEVCTGEGDLTMEINRLVQRAAIACGFLSPRARVARLNAIWRDFLKQYAALAGKQQEQPKKEGRSLQERIEALEAFTSRTKQILRSAEKELKALKQQTAQAPATTARSENDFLQ